MSKIQFELNSQGVGELLKSKEMEQVLEGYAQGISSRAGKGYTAKVMPSRAVVFVEAEAEQDNLDNNTLLKAVR